MLKKTHSFNLFIGTYIPTIEPKNKTSKCDSVKAVDNEFCLFSPFHIFNSLPQIF